MNYLMDVAFHRIDDKVKINVPNLVILKGFTELIHYTNFPEHWIHWSENKMSQDNIFYILAEEFQMIMMNYDFYLEMLEYADNHKNLAFGNIVDNDYLDLKTLALGFSFENGNEALVYEQSIMQKQKQLNYNYLSLNFNVFDYETISSEKQYYPITYETAICNDWLELDVTYDGIFEQANHLSAMINYIDFKALEPRNEINIFEKYDAYKFFNLDISSQNNNTVYERQIESVFEYLKKYKKLN